MTSYLLDTNTCIELLNHRDTRVSQRLGVVHREEIALCSIVKAELYFGDYRSTRCEAN